MARRLVPLALLLVLAAASTPAAALDVVRARRIVAGDVVATGVSLRLADAPALSADRIDAGDAIEPPREVRWTCTPETTADGWRCAGAVSARFGDGPARGVLALSRRTDAITTLGLSRKGARLELDLPDDAPARLSLRGVPLAWAGPWSRRALPDIVPGAGRIDGALVIEAGAAHGEVSVDGIGFDSRDGELAASDLALDAKLALGGAPGARTFSLDATLRRGALLVAPAYLEIPAAPIAFAFDAVQRADGYDVTRWRWHDEGTLAASGTAQIAPDGGVRRMAAATLDATLERAYPRYAKPALGATAFGNLETEGRVQGRLAYVADAPLEGRLELANVTAHDAGGRFALDALSGVVPLAPAQPETTQLSWRSAALHDIAIGGGTLVLRATREGHALASPLALSLLEGRLVVQRFERTRERTVAALSLDGLSVAALTKALGWPEFGGELSGRIPAVRSEGDRIAFDGGLAFEVFGGRIDATSLELERPFGVAPSLAATLALDDLDLHQLTSAFSFGTIEGRLDGSVKGLRLVDWSPVAFDLVLRTDDDYDGKKRISQRAVNSLSAVGGAGAAAGIQTTVLKVFDTFSYDAIGLTCRLANNVCEMGGLDSENGGYTIVRGAGLPRLTVVGHQRRVDWPVLVARLEAATEGAGPVVR